jgi:hypothetical protein
METPLVVVLALAGGRALTLGLSAPKNPFTAERSSVMSMKPLSLP